MANSKKPTTAAASTKTETAAPAASVETPVAAPATTEAAPAKKPAAKKAPAAAPAVVATPAVAVEAPKTESSEAAAPADDAAANKGRRIVTKETVREDFASLIALINEQIDKKNAPAETAAEETPAAAEGAKKKRKAPASKESILHTKALRAINKRLQTLQSDTCRMMKLKHKLSRDNNNSGLMKPVGLSEALFKFLKAAKFEVDQNGQYARTDITKKIHAYIKDNNLRKETDKRIIQPDTKLAALLNFDAANTTEEMTYFRLPVYLKNHFIKL